LKEAADRLPFGLMVTGRSDRALLANPALVAVAADLGLRPFTRIAGLAREGGALAGGGGRGTWLLDKRELGSGRRRVTQVTAVDVTRLDAEGRRQEAIGRDLEAALGALERSVAAMAESAEADEAQGVRADVHDRLGQPLAVLHQIQQGGIGQYAQDALTEALRDLRRALAGVQSGPATLAEVVTRFAQTGVEVRLSGADPGGETGRTLAAVLMEAAANAVRHAGARVVEARIAASGGIVRLDVVDDGAPPPPEIREGTGLAGIRARASRLGGSVEVATRPRYHLTVTVAAEGNSAA
jgi:signal transduction histidine kinase